MWIGADGVVVQTEFSAKDDRLEFTIRVGYHHDPKLDMWIPGSMEEHYRSGDDLEQVNCFAVYTNARRFETSGRVVK